MKPSIIKHLKIITTAFFYWYSPASHSNTVASALIFRNVHIEKVLDGGSFVAITPDKATREVLISGLRAPKGNQHYAAQSVEKLKITLSKFPPTLVCNTTDNKLRSICRVYAGNLDVALEQIRNGAARWDHKNALNQDLEEREAYRESERVARTAGIGLWAKAEPQHAKINKDFRIKRSKKSPNKR